MVKIPSSKQGYTLIELMIVLALLAIVTAIAISSYTNQGIRGNRTEALDELLRQAAFQQRQFTVNNQYSEVDTFSTANGFYQIQTTVNPGGQTFSISATPQTGQDGDTCGTLTLTSIGQRTSSGGDSVRCWAGRNG